ncbi:MAG: Asd/ArgC dimerization domain-containing protein [Acidobacteriaceae bacterium]|nr:Asd/ArgC dimerization domain-containing protein [Acidobacteriaceae bacterium]
MAGKFARAVIVGASSPLGKELAEQLNLASSVVWDIVLADTTTAGQMTAAGDEAAIVQPVAAETFEKADIVFFAGDAAQTREHWALAQASGAGLVDLTGVPAAETKSLMLAPGFTTAQPDLTTVSTSIVHPAAMMLATILKRVSNLSLATATVLLPASNFGDEAMDEMHKQTVALLSFQAVPTEVFGTQVSFALRDESGEDARASLKAVRAELQQQLPLVVGQDMPLALQVLQAPVFHGITASIFLQLSAAETSVADLAEAFRSQGIVVATEGDGEDISNQAANGQGSILLRIRRAEGAANGFWLWAAADNLQLAAGNAIANAVEMLQLRPPTIVQ